ncbi:MAG: glycosyltransferase [Lachnospiraceae bacterium]|nr:glycosyltransferase [Lachnospiraceae bacterium]
MERTGKLILFHTELDTLNLFSNQLKQGFKDLGYEIFEFDLQQSTLSLGLLYDFIKKGSVTAMIGFNSPFFGMQIPSGENMWEVLNIPCINILVDHPYWYHNILMRTPRTGIVLSIDRNHSQYIERFYPHIPCTGFLPHGGTPTDHEFVPIAARKIDVLYAGSLYADYAVSQKPDFTHFHFPAEQVCKRSIDHLLAHPDSTIESVVEDQLLQSGIILPDEELRQFISSCVYIERVVSSHYREKIVSLIAKSGIPLTICGDGWSGCDWITLPNVHYGGRISPEEVLEKMEDSKIVLNTMPWFKDGSHERIFNAMLRGATVVSETSSYLEKTLPADVWVSFNLLPDCLETLPQRIAGLLSDNRKLQSIASSGYRLAASGHTWQARARELHRDLLSLL